MLLQSKVWRGLRPALHPDGLILDENVRLKEGGKETRGEKTGRFCLQDGGKSNVGRICNF